MFRDGESGEHPAALRHESDARAGDVVRRPSHHLLAVHAYRTCAGAQQPGHGVDDGGLARAVVADDRVYRAGRHGEVEPVQHGAAVVSGGQPGEFEHGRHRLPSVAGRSVVTSSARVRVAALACAPVCSGAVAPR